ncbi:hypothetical protein AKG11_00485 [Shinella sp. SUS2]|uniref:hypothetical protein n=1 Tax=unclassified Shinella TaxID=2643062 RepID=UPI000682D885|nr:MULTISPECIES: hypothetical protein [unclassified Shinella]KNY18637.1 hypothetical protein AKG11_00485 [Shinella sp. SUS2]KOC76485.1 hypothetical protein AKG10_05930 [Shinella sp. GWS1]
MGQKTYAIGDRVVLKASRSRSVTGEQRCRTIGILPADHGEAQYRVQIDNENFERRIVNSDIDSDESGSPASSGITTTVAGKSGPWPNPSSMRVGK